MLANDDGTERRRQLLDKRPGQVSEEMQRQMHPLNRVDSNRLMELLERLEWAGQLVADGVGNFDREEDAPAFILIRRHGGETLYRSCRRGGAPPLGHR